MQIFKCLFNIVTCILYIGCKLIVLFNMSIIHSMNIRWSDAAPLKCAKSVASKCALNSWSKVGHHTDKPYRQHCYNLLVLVRCG
jgi:hypothetical protein